MNTISNQLPSLASTLASLAAQTQTASDSTISSFAEPDTGSVPASDTLQVSGSTGETDVQATAREIALQNRFSALEDSSSALTANNSAAALLGSAPDNAASSQANLSAGNVLSLLSES